jgi:hypothetical protein
MSDKLTELEQFILKQAFQIGKANYLARVNEYATPHEEKQQEQLHRLATFAIDEIAEDYRYEYCKAHMTEDWIES